MMNTGANNCKVIFRKEEKSQSESSPIKAQTKSRSVSLSITRVFLQRDSSFCELRSYLSLDAVIIRCYIECEDHQNKCIYDTL